MAAIPGTSATYVPEKYLEGRKPNNKFNQICKEKIIFCFLPSKYLSGTYVADVPGIAATLNFFKYTRLFLMVTGEEYQLPVKNGDADPSIIAP